MARLCVHLLGPFEVTLDSESVTRFETEKVRALLAYLAAESGRPHRREFLSEMLWPDRPQGAARANLRHALSTLRGTIGDRSRSSKPDPDPPFLLVTRTTLQLNPAANAWVDTVAFLELLQGPTPAARLPTAQLEEAVGLYRGSFLEDISVADSATFHEWVLLKRECFRHHTSNGLCRLAKCYEVWGMYQRALEYAWRQVELEPWDEGARRQVMRLLALTGQRGAALAQYQACCRLLSEDLAVEPEVETTELFERIRDEGLEIPTLIPEPPLIFQVPGFLEEGAEEVEPPVFVARERELARLDSFLEGALRGHGCVVFVAGGPGEGKTALLAEFARRAMDAHPDLLVARGECSAYAGVGDPYLPFRDVMEMLAGDVEARWAAGAISRDHARRLWELLPSTVEVLLTAGASLIGTLLHGEALLSRAAAVLPHRVDWLERLQALTRRARNGPVDLQQSFLFKQFTSVLRALADRHPLVLVLDDVQWADKASIGMLFHLGRRLAGKRILIACAYRPEEVALGRAGERHPLEKALHEFRRTLGDVWVELDRADQTEGRRFVDAFLGTEPNRLGEGFREALFHRTEGHPLFTIELLRAMQERGDLVRDAEGRWVEGPRLDWETLPARVEAVIAQRIGRLAPPLRAVLRVASVEGEQFTGEVVARVRSTDEQEMLRRLSRELDRQHRLIRAQSIVRIDRQVLSSYRFRHILFQRYLYSSLDEGERVRLHEQVGTALEVLYGAQEQVAAIAVQLALHFQKARITEKAIRYLRQAGERAIQLSAYHEAIAHLTRGLALLKSLPDCRGEDDRLDRAHQELAFQMSLGIAWTGGSGTQAPEVRSAYTEARELCKQTGTTSQLCQVLGELSVHYYVRAEHRRALEMAGEALGIAQQAKDPLLAAVCHWYMGIVLFSLGEYKGARAHLQETISFYEPQQHHRHLVSLRGSDVGVSALAYDACCLWSLGYPEQAAKRSEEALALARELDHAFSQADVLYYAGCMFNDMRRNAQALRQSAEELAGLSTDAMPGWSAAAVCFRGEALVRLGQIREGIARIRDGVAALESSGELCYLSGDLRSLAEALAVAGRPEEALTTVAEALALVEETDERHWETELHRVRGELLLAQGDEAGARAALHKAVEVARRQQAKSWELRATVSLCRLWQQQGRREEARRRLDEVYGWFTEGLDTADLVEAKRLLEELSP
ncbi:MAG: BTAD domain-containing putative transcriptional regulator [Anaerolineae bacterium]|jgi:DNA-binding SARP family transcriptional activator/predicted ATPase